MDRMKTFLIYVLFIIGFFILSLFLEDGLLMAMYSTIEGEFDGYYSAVNSEFEMEDITAKACNINGYINFQLVNTTGSFINQCYLKIDLYNEQNLLADTEYIEVTDMQSGDSVSYNISFKANNIKEYNISIVGDVPDTSNIISVLGWEIDLTDVFGHDFSDTTIFGVKLTDIFSLENAKVAGSNAWTYIKIFLASIPWWGYAIGGGIVAWYMPAFYLFGIL